MPYSIGFEHLLTDRTPEDAYRIIEAWLLDQKAKLKSSQSPSRIEASHGRALQPMGWKKDAKKTMAFGIIPRGQDVLVRVSVAPAILNISDVTMREDEARANWNELLAGLWTRFGERDALSLATSQPPVDWSASRKRGTVMFLSGMVLVGISIALFAIWPRVADYAATGAGVVGALLVVNGIATSRAAKGRLAKQRELQR